MKSAPCLIQVKEDTVRLLLPHLVAGLGGNGSADYHAATLMIVTLLASKATLSEGLLTGMLHVKSKLCTCPECSADDELLHQLRELAPLCAVFQFVFPEALHCLQKCCSVAPGVTKQSRKVENSFGLL